MFDSLKSRENLVKQTHGAVCFADRLELMIIASGLSEKNFSDRCSEGMKILIIARYLAENRYRALHSMVMQSIANATGVRLEWLQSGALPVFEEMAK